ncbi:unnamed protein product [Cylicocyclus nassatus]|uniref:Uncharacterized protein n=1 Tax=Cylicocyclus nassatus TaxID=53992 RepID=A0AA36GEK2_CYLNA|nr:unnamed protein product [Cylicocyclus nassatus]
MMLYHRARMLTHTEIPQLLKRHHIVKGYRPLYQPVHYYYISAFRPHNELINIWTHLVPAICLIVFYLIPEVKSPTRRLPVLVLYTGIGVLLFASAMAHLLHSRSTHDHIFWFLIDFTGIALFGCSIGLQRYSCSKDMSMLMTVGYVPGLLLVVLVLQFLSASYMFVCRPDYKWRLEIRMLTCLLLAAWASVPLLSRYMGENVTVDESLYLHTNALNWLLLSGVFMGAKVPERFAPGLFDIFGYGHQLFHLCITMVAWNLCDAAHYDCAPAPWTSPRNIAISVAFLLSVFFTVGTVKILSKKAQTLKYD